jgi:hypothetical protein
MKCLDVMSLDERSVDKITLKKHICGRDVS